MSRYDPRAHRHWLRPERPRRYRRLRFRHPRDACGRRAGRAGGAGGHPRHRRRRGGGEARGFRPRRRCVGVAFKLGSAASSASAARRGARFRLGRVFGESVSGDVEFKLRRGEARRQMRTHAAAGLKAPSVALFVQQIKRDIGGSATSIVCAWRAAASSARATGRRGHSTSARPTPWQWANVAGAFQHAGAAALAGQLKQAKADLAHLHARARAQIVLHRFRRRGRSSAPPCR